MCKSFMKYCVKTCNLSKLCIILLQYAYILVILMQALPNYHYCLLSSNLLSVLRGREECSVISLCMYTYWILLILTLISTLNVPICKFKYQSTIIMEINICLIIMQISICLIIVQTTICLIFQSYPHA